MDEPIRRMPERINLGREITSTMAAPMGRWRDAQDDRSFEGRTVMGYRLPLWQRGLVWTDRQKIAFVESAWRGIALGTYSYNQAPLGSPFDFLLIDGQQRMSAIEAYLTDQFPVFGWLWSEVTAADRRRWTMTTVFASYVTDTEDEEYLRGYYDLLNFGGTSHREEQRATA